MESLLYSYALAKSLYETNKDYLDTFVPFVCITLESEQSGLGIFPIKDRLKERFKIDIPDHVVGEICNRGVVKEYLSRQGREYTVTDEGQSYIQELLKERDVERKANHLGKHFAEYLKRKSHKDVGSDDALKLLTSFINRNLGPLTSFLQSPQLELENGDNDSYTRMIIKFITEIEESDPVLFETISDLVYGSVVCTIVQARDEYVPKTLKDTRVFLDSNVLFSILEYDHVEVALPRKELFSLLGQEGCHLFVFDFTIDEIVRVLRGYDSFYNGLWRTVRVDSVYSNLKNAGKTPQDISIMIANLVDDLQKLGIEVWKTGHDFFSIPEAFDFSPLLSYKPNKGDRSLYHDMLAIDEVQRLREHNRIRKLEESKAIFLGSS